MNPPKLQACIEEIRGYLSGLGEVEKAVIYGSAALGTAGESSDLDLFVIAPRSRHEPIAQKLYDIGAGHGVTVSPYMLTAREIVSLDMQFLESIARDGIVLKGEPLDPTLSALNLQAQYLVTLYLDHLPQEEKMRLSRELYGYTSARRYKKKRYESRTGGFLDSVGGRRLARGTFLVPARAWPDLDSLIRKHRAKRWAFTVWVQKP
jgi:hypothetical protein